MREIKFRAWDTQKNRYSNPHIERTKARSKNSL